MEEFIFDTRKKISIINLELTQEHLSAAASKVEENLDDKQDDAEEKKES